MSGNHGFEHINAYTRLPIPPLGRSFRHFEQGFEHSTAKNPVLVRKHMFKKFFVYITQPQAQLMNES